MSAEQFGAILTGTALVVLATVFNFILGSSVGLAAGMLALIFGYLTNLFSDGVVPSEASTLRVVLVIGSFAATLCSTIVAVVSAI